MISSLCLSMISGQTLRVCPEGKPVRTFPDHALGHSGGPGPLAFDGPVDGVDQDLGLDEFDPRPLGLVAIERRGKRLCKGVAVIGHALARLFQRLKSLAHVCLAFLSRDCYWREMDGQ